MKIKIASVNVRGLGGQHKRRDVLHYMRNLNFDIIFMQDTHLTPEKIPYFDSLWKGSAYHCCYTHNSRGTTILINRNVGHEVLFEVRCNEGNYMIIGCRIGTDTYVMGSIYGPNRDNPDFYQKLDECLDNTDCDHVIIGGDFNFVLDAEKDCYGYARENNCNAKNVFTNICAKHSLVDAWRLRNTDKTKFTWMRNNPCQGARLDMFFISDHLSSLCCEIEVLPGYRTDHSIVYIEMQIGKSERGPGLWKFNESLLQDESYVKMVEACIDQTVEQYAIPLYTQSYLADSQNYDTIEFQIKEDLFYETLLMMIRGETVKFAKLKNRRMKEKETELSKKIANAQRQHFEKKTEESALILKRYKDELEDLRKPLIAGLIVRSRTRWHEEGERSSKYFLSLEKRNALRKSVVSLKIGEKILTRTNTVLGAFTDDISGKYNEQHIMPSGADAFIRENVETTLDCAERSALEAPLSYAELTEALQKTKKGKSPGANGFTAAFFKFFWNRLGPFLYRAFVTRLQMQQMLPSHREGIITMIPKAGKAPDNLKAWRPITLLNADFKIISSAIAIRLQRVIGKLINPCQTAYIKGRYIGENNRLIYDVINQSKEKANSIIMSADFQAAFDSISWKFISQVLKAHHFGIYFRNLISMIYLSEENFSRIMLNGYLGEKIFLKRGIRQGDPMSGYLFNLAANILSSQVTKSQVITGIRLSENCEVRISQYADDTILFLNDTPSSVKAALSELNVFSDMSGLKLNVEKTSCLPIGGDSQKSRNETFGLKWVQELRILGVMFSTNNENITNKNIESKVMQIKKEIAQWRRRYITPLGKITVIKSLLLSKLVHLFTALPNPPRGDMKELERLLFSFLWGNKRDPVKRSKVIQNFAAGGLEMIDIQAFVKSLKLSWLKRLTASSATWVKVASKDLPDITTMLQFGSKKIRRECEKVNNVFWKDVLEAFADFSQNYETDAPLILTENLWFNDFAKFKYTIVKDWDRKGIRFLDDLVDDGGHLLSREALQAKFGIRLTFLCYSSLVRSLSDKIKLEAEGSAVKPIIPLRMNLVMNEAKFTRVAYATLVKCRKNEYMQAEERQRQKWVRDIGCYKSGSFRDALRMTRSAQLRVFHYKVINRIVTTNTFLKIIRIKDDDMCTFCKEEPESLAHLFWHCEKVQSFIAQVITFLRTDFQIVCHISPENWFFLNDLNPINALVFTIAKRVIYKAKLEENIPNTSYFKASLKYEADIEYTSAKLARKVSEFEEKWGNLRRIRTEYSQDD